MITNVLVIKADKDPLPGVEQPTPNQIYRNVRVFTEHRQLRRLRRQDIRIEVSYVGICGTDVHVTTNSPDTGYITCSAPLSIPEEGRVIGHEGIGKIIDVGADVTHLKPGMYVALESIIVCHQCPACKRGKFNQCRNAKLLGLEQDGIMGTVVDVPASIAHNVTDYIRSEQDLIAAANIEPAAVAYVGCENARIRPGDKMVIFGAGPIGLFAAMLGKSVFGASEVHMVEPNLFRRQFSRTWSDYIYDVDSFFEECPKDVDVVIEASAVLQNVNRIFRNINANGRVVLLGRRGIPLHIQHVDHMITNEISVTGSRGHLGGAFHQVMRLHRARRIDLSAIVTRTVTGIEEIRELLMHPDLIEYQNCKLMVNMAGAHIIDSAGLANEISSVDSEKLTISAG